MQWRLKGSKQYYQVSTHIYESPGLGSVDGVKIVESAGFRPIEAGEQLPGFLVVVQHLWQSLW